MATPLLEVSEINDTWLPSVLDACCIHNIDVWRSVRAKAKATFPGLTTLPLSWMSSPDCHRCKDLEQIMLFKEAKSKHPQSANPENEYAFTLTMPPDYTTHKPLEDVASLILLRRV